MASSCCLKRHCVLVAWLCGVAADAAQLRQHVDLAAPVARQRLPTQFPERVSQVCGFDDAAATAGEGPWAQYAQKHRQMRDDGRLLVYVAGEGLGARLRGTAIALLVAMETGRALQIEWDGLEQHVQPNFIDWRPSDAAREAAEGREGQSQMGEDRMQRLLKEAGVAGVASPALRLPRRFAKLFAASKFAQDSALPAMVVLPHVTVADLPNRPLSELFPKVMAQLAAGSRNAPSVLGCSARFLFSLAPSLQASVAQVESQLPRPLVGIQMRFGDVVAYKQHDTTVYGGDDTRLKPAVSAVSSALRCPRDRHLLEEGGAAAKVLFASDWSKAREWASNSSDPKVTVLDLIPAHLDGLEKAGGGATSIANGLWEELLVLASADAMVASGSRAVTDALFTNSLLNRTGGSHGLCRASFFALGAAAVGMLPADRIDYAMEDCGIGCERPRQQR